MIKCRVYVSSEGQVMGVVKPDTEGDARPPGLGWKIVDLEDGERVWATLDAARVELAAWKELAERNLDADQLARERDERFTEAEVREALGQGMGYGHSSIPVILNRIKKGRGK